MSVFVPTVDVLAQTVRPSSIARKAPIRRVGFVSARLSTPNPRVARDAYGVLYGMNAQLTALQIEPRLCLCYVFLSTNCDGR